ncbi:Gfo/Idh/MocA family protein [Haloarchaeobius sp. HRN-SO-5]|uniref:Gfo/Idh/MocA family protein n=1 Tax=Haloarchaeobius sp. HRN-SO-5 TaxID=3446118 RepID=UPI003EB6CA4E
MKLAVVGAGYWGSNHARIASELVESGVVDDALLCELDEERAREVAADNGLQYVTDHRQLADYGVDAAVVATPSPTHESIVVDLLEDDIDAMVEKPLALSVEAANNIVQTAAASDRTLGVGHVFRHHPALDALRERMQAGELGEVTHLRTVRHACQPARQVGALHSLAVHEVDIYRYLLDQNPDTVYCRLDAAVATDTHDTATLVLGFDDVTGVVSESWTIPVAGKRRDLVVVGSEGVAAVDYLEDTVVEFYDVPPERSDDGTRQGHMEELCDPRTVLDVDGAEPLKSEVTDFVTAVRDGRQPLTTGVDGAWAVKLLADAERSAERNAVVDVRADAMVQSR